MEVLNMQYYINITVWVLYYAKKKKVFIFLEWFLTTEHANSLSVLQNCCIWFVP